MCFMMVSWDTFSFNRGSSHSVRDASQCCYFLLDTECLHTVTEKYNNSKGIINSNKHRMEIKTLFFHRWHT